MTQQKLPHLQPDGYASLWFSVSASSMGVNVQENRQRLPWSYGHTRVLVPLPLSPRGDVHPFFEGGDGPCLLEWMFEEGTEVS